MKLYHIIKLISSSGELSHQMSRISKNNYKKQLGLRCVHRTNNEVRVARNLR